MAKHGFVQAGAEAVDEGDCTDVQMPPAPDIPHLQHPTQNGPRITPWAVSYT